jgi:hypothetical protein
MSLSFRNHVTELETLIRRSDWWQRASQTADSHYSNKSGIMLTHHLEAVYDKVVDIFIRPETGFYSDIFDLVRFLKLDKKLLYDELKIIALLHDIGKTAEDKSQVIPHPLTGKPAHLRHGIAGQIAAMEIIGNRTVELHDISYGLYRQSRLTGIKPGPGHLQYISNKIHGAPGCGFIYLLLFKLADIHGHEDIDDVLWFYRLVNDAWFYPHGLYLPIPKESDIR